MRYSIPKTFKIPVGGVDAASNFRVWAAGMPTPEKKNLKITITEDRRDRSAEQNALQHVWYQEIAKQRGDVTPAEVKMELKLNLGVPILCRDDDEFHHVFANATVNLHYEDKLALMLYLDVTSLFNITQAKEYMDEIQNQYSAYQLTQPEN